MVYLRRRVPTLQDVPNRLFVPIRIHTERRASMGSAEAARTAESAEATRAVRAGSPGCYSVLEHPSGSDFLRKPLAEWHRGALGGKLPPRPAGSRHRAQ